MVRKFGCSPDSAIAFLQAERDSLIHQGCQEYSCVKQKKQFKLIKIRKGISTMKSSKSGNAPVSFMQRRLQNNFFLLTMVLAFSVVAFVGVGLFRLIG